MMTDPGKFLLTLKALKKLEETSGLLQCHATFVWIYANDAHPFF